MKDVSVADAAQQVGMKLEFVEVQGHFNCTFHHREQSNQAVSPSPHLSSQ